MKQVIRGSNIYKDERGRTFIYDKRKNIGYLIQEKNYKEYQLYSNRYILLVILFVLFSNFITRWEYVLILIIIIGIGFEYSYRKKFLPSLTSFARLKQIKRVTPIESLIEKGNKPTCLLLGLAYLTVSILMMINIFITKTDLINIVGNIIISLGAFYFALIHLIAFLKMHK